MLRLLLRTYQPDRSIEFERLVGALLNTFSETVERYDMIQRKILRLSLNSSTRVRTRVLTTCTVQIARIEQIKISLTPML